MGGPLMSCFLFLDPCCFHVCQLGWTLANVEQWFSGGNQWTTGIRAEIASVVDDTLQHVPAPRLLQMYVLFWL
jgi:hypothetical protein